jgi:hypothetical protein
MVLVWVGGGRWSVVGNRWSVIGNQYQEHKLNIPPILITDHRPPTTDHSNTPLRFPRLRKGCCAIASQFSTFTR